MIGQQPRHSRCFQAEHDLAKCQNFHHCPSLLLQQMYRKSADLVLEIDRGHPLALVFGRLHIADKALFRKFGNRQ